jgi:major membrane immunogen (membrane-anchored lipoprotein)
MRIVKMNHSTMAAVIAEAKKLNPNAKELRSGLSLADGTYSAKIPDDDDFLGTWHIKTASGQEWLATIVSCYVRVDRTTFEEKFYGLEEHSDYLVIQDKDFLLKLKNGDEFEIEVKNGRVVKADFEITI